MTQQKKNLENKQERTGTFSFNRENSKGSNKKEAPSYAKENQEKKTSEDYKNNNNYPMGAPDNDAE
jgi:hypothetical protein